jgi:Amt family ammonium transporter
VALAVLVPVLALGGRERRGVLMALAVLVGGLVYPLAGNWVWGGGWLASLGTNLGWGHGFVDLGGSATVHLLGAGLALIGILAIGRRRPSRASQVVELPPAYFPLFSLTGALLAPIGWVAMVLANPLVTPDLAPGLVAVTLTVAAVGGAAPGLLYSWLATGRTNPQLAARGVLAGLVAASAGGAFMTPVAAFAAGIAAGGLLPLVSYLIEHRLRWQDPNATLATHGLPGLIGALWVALWADGRWGVGWNGVPSPPGVPQQGVAGLLVAPGRFSDVPGQLWAQLAGSGAILLLGVSAAALLFAVALLMQAVTAKRGATRRPVSRMRSARR